MLTSGPVYAHGEVDGAFRRLIASMAQKLTAYEFLAPVYRERVMFDLRDQTAAVLAGLEVSASHRAETE